MLSHIIKFALNNRLLILIGGLLISLWGLWTASRMPIDVLPDLNRPVVTILTEGHGMIPEDVERFVTWPIEQVVSGATGVHRVRSLSGNGLSMVYVEFDWGTDIYKDRQIVAEKLQLVASRLPEGTSPTMTPISSIMGQVQIVGFQGDEGDWDTTALRRLIERDIKPRLLALSGISQVILSGGRATELQVIVDAEKLAAWDVTLNEVEEAVRKSNITLTGGNLNQGARAPLVTLPGLVQGDSDVKSAVVRHDPIRPVLLGDVAEVEFGPSQIPVGEAGINGKPGVMAVILKQPGVDTVQLTDRIVEELDSLGEQLPAGITIIPNVFQQAEFIHRAIDNVFDAIRDGGILVVIVLFLFLLNFRTTLITLLAIPISVACAALVFRALGLSINTMTLGGLAVAIGTLVDDAIVDVENVLRRLHQNAHAKNRRGILQVVFDASCEIRKPVFYGTLLVTVVYLPLFFLTGMEGRLFAPIGLAYIVSVVASLLVAMTITPVLCYYLLGKREVTRKEYGSRIIRAIQAGVGKLIAFSVRYPLHIAMVTLAVAVFCGILLLQQGTAFLPEFNEGSYQVNLVLEPDASLDTSDRFGRRLEQVLMEVEGVRHVGRRTGRAEGDEHVMPVNISEAIITIDPALDRGRQDMLDDIRHRLETEFPGVVAATEQPLKHLLDALLSGVNATMAIKISGPNLDVLRQAAKEVEAALKDVPGVIDLNREQQVLIDQVEVAPRRTHLKAHGLTIEDLAETVHLALGGDAVSSLQLGQVRYPIVIRLEKEDRANLSQIERLRIKTPAGNTILVRDVAEVQFKKSPTTIRRESGQRQVLVQHNIGGRALGDVARDVRERLKPIEEKLAAVESSYAIRMGGQHEAQESASQTILVLSIVSLMFMFLILYAQFHSIRIAFVVLLASPLAFIGSALAVVITDQEVSIATLVGMIAVLGVATRNAILLVDHYLHLMREEGLPLDISLIMRAGRERAIPILMTALTSGIALVPLALSAGQPGKEILYPVATVIIGGLISSTLLDFLVTPGLFWTFARTHFESRTSDPSTTP